MEDLHIYNKLRHMPRVRDRKEEEAYRKFKRPVYHLEGKEVTEDGRSEVDQNHNGHIQ